MKQDSETKAKALALRKKGKSYNEIRRALNIPKSTLSDWLRDIGWSRMVRQKLEENAAKIGKAKLRKLNHVRGIALQKIYSTAREEAIHEFEFLKWFPLFIAGIALYLGEGDKRTHGVIRLSNTDPAIIKTFILFLIIYPDLDPEACLQFWAEQTGMTRQSFNKCVTIQGRHKTRRLPYGVCNIFVSSTYLKEKMGVWLELVPKELAKQKIAGIV